MNLNRSPKPAKSWSRRKQARPGEILEAALKVFAEKGFAAARMEDIAKRAGVTKGTIYLYFPSKEEVFKSLARKHRGRHARQRGRRAGAAISRAPCAISSPCSFHRRCARSAARPSRGAAQDHHRRKRQLPRAGALLAHRSHRQGAGDAVAASSPRASRAANCGTCRPIMSPGCVSRR